MHHKAKKYLNVAKAVAEFSKDQSTKVGAVLVDPEDGAIVAVGYNGFVRGAPDDIMPQTRPEKYKYVIHAELNLTKLWQEVCTLYRVGMNCPGQISVQNNNLKYGVTRLMSGRDGITRTQACGECVALYEAGSSAFYKAE